jgi:hypothetical protein
LPYATLRFLPASVTAIAAGAGTGAHHKPSQLATSMPTTSTLVRSITPGQLAKNGCHYLGRVSNLPAWQQQGLPG